MSNIQCLAWCLIGVCSDYGIVKTVKAVKGTGHANCPNLIGTHFPHVLDHHKVLVASAIKMLIKGLER